MSGEGLEEYRGECEIIFSGKEGESILNNIGGTQNCPFDMNREHKNLCAK